ncbi:single-stranded DNA-binding protein Rim1p, mitochondrial [[Candida] anglica]|uniref:Single-stranded DNA-binding protein n=1 Tax=[Candida] anglica TaxID=148631 RepID=A0ABP0EJZ1_9ASCO
MLSRSFTTQLRSFSSSSSRSAFAKLTLLGSVGSVQHREKKDGSPFINYSLAVNHFVPNSEERPTDWFNISVFNERQVKFFSDHITPGTQLYVECDFRQNTVVDENGDKRVYPNYVMRNFDIVKLRKKEENFEEEA